jgi:hypothetical protein
MFRSMDIRKNKHYIILYYIILYYVTATGRHRATIKVE